MAKHSIEVSKWLQQMQTRSLRYPHKSCLLLAVLEMAEGGMLEGNSITYNSWLIESFSRYFQIVKNKNQHDRPYEPFVHISHDEIWTLIAQPGYEEEVRRKRHKGSTSEGWVQKYVSHASLDAKFAAQIKKPEYREVLRRDIVESCFHKHRESLYSLIRSRSLELDFERTLREVQSVLETLRAPAVNGDAAFRRTVLETYNYTCAATGWKAVDRNVQLLDAVHLIPLNESNDNRVRNGIVLTPTYHRAMDSNLIAPGPDGKWHVAAFVNDLDVPEEFEPIRQLIDRPVDYGGSPHRPDPYSLEVQVDRLAKSTL